MHTSELGSDRDGIEGGQRQESAGGRTARWLHLLTQPLLLLGLLGLITLTVLWISVLNLTRIEVENTRQTAAALTHELLETYEAQVVRVLREMDQTLKTLQHTYEMRGDAGATLESLRERDLLPPNLVYVVSMTDADGRVVASTREASLGGTLDTDFVERTKATDGAVEGDRVKIDDEWWLRFARPLALPDGQFAGVAVVEVDASFFVSGYETGDLGRNGILAVLGTDGIFRVRRSGEEVIVGGQVVYDSIVTSSGLNDTEVVLSINEWDDVRRYTSGRELYDFPLAVVIGLAEDEQLAPARASAATYRLRGAGISLVLLLALSFLGRTTWKLEELRRREREFRAAHAKRVEHLAYHDGLTGLPNRPFLTKIIDDRIRQSTRFGRRFALLFLDLDGFKQINDTLGHDAGDDLLREVAKRLEDGLRKSDTVARMGGDEFMIVLPDIESEAQVTHVAKKVLSSLAEPFILLGEKFSITVSIGVSIFPLDGEDEQTLMKNADIAMYTAKDGGKNNFRYFSAEMSKASQERLNLESSLRNALSHEEFELYYQARRDLKSGQVTGVEALIRWNHPTLGMLTPNKFLPLAEETGLILPIGRWVLRMACQQSAEWRGASGVPRLTVAVNLSARQFFDPHLPDDIAVALAEAEMEPDLLELEISEGILARDTRQTLPVLERLKALGVRITVDNFGTGYSALTALGELPFDTIKIDRLFLREDAGNATARDVINGVLAMGRVLSPSVIAHGVETREQVDFLRTRAFNEVQGFYFGRPFRASEVCEALRAEDVELAAARGGRRAIA